MSGQHPSSETEPTQARHEHPRDSRRRRPGLVRIFPLEAGAAPLTFEIRTEAVIGRGGQSDLSLPDGQISRRHATVEAAAGGLGIRDMGSRHGTFVDGRPAGSQRIPAKFGSVVRAGDTLLLVVEDVAPYANEPRRLKASLVGMHDDLVAGPKLLRTWAEATRAASLSHPVLIIGESGAGKEVVARLVHGGGKERPFVALNVAAVPEALFEAELFGYAKGAFTGATAARTGAFLDASGGVLFLDEIGELQLDLQVKLLRAIDQRRIRSVGARTELDVDTRVVAATNRDLAERSAEGLFRLDLYHRLAGIVIRVPPLRERRDEIMMVVLSMLAQEHHRSTLSADAAEALVLADWPGNVRELRHVVTRACLATLHDGRTRIEKGDLPELANVEENDCLTAEAVRATMRRVDGNATRAAKVLGVSRATLYNAFRRFDLNPRELRGGS
ncbi:MAG TPA: sigma 54-interacting transcriptional regulator [Polyangiaceae bacterium]|nr:sigma 54-interacting transcriptional regulator [Polyangiaceae bacterium]